MVKVTESGRPAAARTELAAVLECTHDAVVGVTPPGVINSWNPAARALYGWAPEEIIGHHLDDLVAPARRAGDADVLRRVVRGGQTERYDTTWICNDDRVVTVSLTESAIIDAAGDVVGVVLVCSEQNAATMRMAPTSCWVGGLLPG